MNRWRALVEIVRILAKSGRPGLAFAAVCVVAVPVAALVLAIAYVIHQ